MSKNVVYKFECKLCLKEGNKAVYYGEMFRSGYERAIEHADLIRRMDPESSMLDQNLQHHKDS